MRLEPTGERVIEEHYQNSREDYLIYLFHLATYNFARKYIQEKCVLDYGCGSGYGSALIANDCKQIICIDIASDAIAYAKDHYQAHNLSYETVKPADEASLPFTGAIFDTVLSFQVIEHIGDVQPYLSEIHRVLKPGGVLVLSTPDRTGRLFPFQKPWNMWHIKEYSTKDLARTLKKYFSSIHIQRMGGKQEVLKIELARTRKLRWMTLPFTLPVIPEILRINSLRILKRFKKMNQTTLSHHKQQFDFDESALLISSAITRGVNLIAVAYKQLA